MVAAYTTTLGISLPDTAGILMVNMCPIAEWSINWIVTWIFKGPYKRTQTAVHQCLLRLPQYTRRRSTGGRKRVSRVLRRLVYPGASGVGDERRATGYMRRVDEVDLFQLVYPALCTPAPRYTRPGYRCGAAPVAGPVRIMPQFESFYTVSYSMRLPDSVFCRLIPY